jgi:small subunit ribosomal protein S8
MDPIGDMLTRIRNGQSAKKEFVELNSSKHKVEICRVLEEEGYIRGYSVSGDVKPKLKIVLKYKHDGLPVIDKIIRKSSPGLRVYASADNIPKTVDGLGVTVVSTSAGVMSDRKARNRHGGEILFSVS